MDSPRSEHMKPVPISAVSRSRRTSSALRERPSRAARLPSSSRGRFASFPTPTPRPTPALARVLREAALAARPPQRVEERRERPSLENAWANVERAPPREEPPAVDVEKLVAEAYERGLHEGARRRAPRTPRPLARERADSAGARDREPSSISRSTNTPGSPRRFRPALPRCEQRIAASVTRASWRRC